MALVTFIVFSLIVLFRLRVFTKAHDCILPTLSEFNDIFISLAISKEPTAQTQKSDRPKYICMAQGSSKETYRELSAMMKYRYQVYSYMYGFRVKQFELDCNGDVWEGRAGSLRDAPANWYYSSSVVAMTTCSSCVNTAPNGYHCQACDATCNTGLMSCTGPTASDCCLAFDGDGSCLATTTSCSKAGYVATAENNWECVCGLNCSSGYTHNVLCTECVLVDICKADNPCQNGGTCVLGSAPDIFTCNCINQLFTATNSNCTEEMSDNPESYKSEYARTCFDSNNQGKTIVKDEKGKLTILMCPLN